MVTRLVAFPVPAVVAHVVPYGFVFAVILYYLVWKHIVGRLNAIIGIDAERVTSPDDLEAALRSALAARAPALIEVGVGPMSNVWPVIGPAGGVYPIMLDPPNVG